MAPSRRQWRPLAEAASSDGPLIGQRRHQMCGVDRAPARDRVDELEVGEGEQHREGHDHRDDRRQHRKGDKAEPLPRTRAVERRRLVERRRNGLQASKQSYRHEWNAAPDIGGDHRPTGVPGLAEKIDVLMDRPSLMSDQEMIEN